MNQLSIWGRSSFIPIFEIQKVMLNQYFQSVNNRMDKNSIFGVYLGSTNLENGSIEHFGLGK